MHAALLSRPLEVTMLTRRIAASACALALIAPAAAVAHPADNGPAATRAGVVYGDTQYDQQNQQDQGSPKPSRVDQIAAMSPAQLSAAYGARTPSVTADVYVPPADSTKVYHAPAPARTPATASSDTSDGWQIAAIGEAALLAALGFGTVA